MPCEGNHAQISSGCELRVYRSGPGNVRAVVYGTTTCPDIIGLGQPCEEYQSTGTEEHLSSNMNSKTCICKMDTIDFMNSAFCQMALQSMTSTSKPLPNLHFAKQLTEDRYVLLGCEVLHIVHTLRMSFCCSSAQDALSVV